MSSAQCLSVFNSTRIRRRSSPSERVWGSAVSTTFCGFPAAVEVLSSDIATRGVDQRWLRGALQEGAGDRSRVAAVFSVRRR